MARDLGKTRAELLTGTPQPITTAELGLWHAFYIEEARQWAARAKAAATNARAGAIALELDDLP